MKAVTFAIPGDIATISGGYNYDRRVMEELQLAGFETHHCALPASFPDPTAADCQTMLALLSEPEVARPIVVDGLAWGALPKELARQVSPGVIALCHHPLGLENGIDPQRAEYLLANEAANLSHADAIIVTSDTTKQTLVRDMGQNPDRIVVAEPGTDAAQRARGSHRDAPLELLCVGAVIPRKGYDTLVQALSRLSGLEWHLHFAGSLERSPECVTHIQSLIEKHDLSSRIILLGEIGPEELEETYLRSDIFVLPSRYEGYGMVLAEAMARGLAIITTTGGAAANTVPDDAGIKIPPDDEDALMNALRNVMTDLSARQGLSDASWAAGQSLPGWHDTASTIAALINRVGRG